MREPRTNAAPSRREAIRTAGQVAVGSALAGMAIPAVHAGGEETIKLALVGCGGRGTGAAANALASKNGPTQLVAMADLFEDRLASSYTSLSEQFGRAVAVPPERRFVGFDAFRHAVDAVAPGGVVLLTTHAAYRVVHFEYAATKGVHCFLEKSIAPDPGGVRRVLAANENAKAAGVKVACGLMCRHSPNRQALIERIRAGELGDIDLIRANRLGPSIALEGGSPEPTELLWQIRRPYFFHWLSAGLFLEMSIHQIDECCWLKDGWPVEARGLGGRFDGSTDRSQNLDSYDVEYRFADGARAIVQGRYLSGAESEFATWVHGTRRAAQFSGNIHAGTVHTYAGKVIDPKQVDWRAPDEPLDPWQVEWNDFLAAIRADRPYNELERACNSTLAGIMGRAAVHTGLPVTWDEVNASSFQFAPEVAALTAESPSPLPALPNGCYPVPVPGAWSEL